MASDTNVLVGDVLLSVPPVIHFLHPLVAAEVASWDSLQAQIAHHQLSLGADKVSWDLSASQKFSVKSMYNKLTEGNTLDTARGLWKARLPLKIKIFLWQMFRNHLPTADNVPKRNGPSDGSCVVCEMLEDANHALFQCALARFAWTTVREVFQQKWNPRSGANLLAVLQSQHGANVRVLW